MALGAWPARARPFPSQQAQSPRPLFRPCQAPFGHAHIGRGPKPNPFRLRDNCPHGSFAWNVTRTKCIAVGNPPPITVVRPDRGRPSWTALTVSTPPAPPRAQASSLNDISCISPRWCLTVGAYQNIDQSTLDGLLEHWDGSAWRVMTRSDAQGSAIGLA